MADFEKVAKTSDIPVGEMAPFEVGHREIVIAHTEDGFFAVADECSHDAAPISDGEIFGCEVECARHGARFNLKTGQVTAPPAIAPIDSIELKIEGDDILVRVEE